MSAQSSVPLEYRAKARMLINFPNFINWPDSAFPSEQAIFSVCVLGEFKFGTSLAELARGAMSHGRPMEIRWLKREQDPRSCQILFVSESESRRYASILGLVRGSNVLTIGETPDFLDAGGVVGFSFQEDMLKFDVNLDAATGQHLKLSSQMLALAHRVVGKRGDAKS